MMNESFLVCMHGRRWRTRHGYQQGLKEKKMRF